MLRAIGVEICPLDQVDEVLLEAERPSVPKASHALVEKSGNPTFAFS
jgi:hypothetical protein